MNLDFDKWKEFRFGDLINNIYKAHAYTKSDLEETFFPFENSIRYITRTAQNSGCEMMANRDGIKFIEAGNAISIGDTTATCFYQEEDFITGDHMVIIRADWLNRTNALFIITMLNKECYRYSYGRAFLMDRIKETVFNFPIKTNEDDTPFIDETKKYSKDGFVPDWEFMENYIKSLNHKPVTTKKKSNKVMDLRVDDWAEFKIPLLFEVYAGNYYSKDEYEDGMTPYVSASDTGNGVSQLINLKYDFSGNKITIGKIGATAYYQPENFCATSDVNVLTPLFDMNKYHGLFIVQIINTSENYKWSYGRQCRVGDTKEIIIKLPIQKNSDGTPFFDKTKKYSELGYVPDWLFMENFIKSLPYGDRI